MNGQPRPRATPGGLQLIYDFFGYVADFSPTIAAAATATFPIAVQADADFEWRTLSDSELATSTVHYTIQITDSGSGRNLLDRPASSRSIVGSGRDPYILPAPKRVARNSNLIVTVVNLNGAATISDLRILLGGYKIFKLPSGQFSPAA